MKLSATNNIKSLSNVRFKANFAAKIPELQNDVFVKTQDTFAKALEEAKNWCMESAQKEKPYERCAAVDKQGNILFKVEGEYSRVKPDLYNLPKETVVIHSHPGENLIPFSIEDIIGFVPNHEIIQSIVVDKTGKICTMTKPEGFMQMFMNHDQIKAWVNETFMQDWLKYAGIEPKLDDEYVGFCENLLLKMSDDIDTIDQLYQTLEGNSKKENLDEIYEQLQRMFHRRNTKAITPLEYCYSKSLKTHGHLGLTPEGIEFQKAFNEKVANKYDYVFEYDVK